MASRFLALAAGLLLLVCACEPAATPLPVNLDLEATVTSAAPPPTEAPTELRYAVTADTLPYISPDDQQLIAAHAQIITLDAPPNPADLGGQYEIVVTLDDLADSTTTPTPLTVSLVINSALPPLDDPALAEIVGHAANASADAPTLRRDLANAGYPDGFDLTLASRYAPGADALEQRLNALNLQTRITTNPDEAAHLILTTAPTESEAQNAISLLTIPIHYRTIEGLSITFTPSGYPIAERSR